MPGLLRRRFAHPLFPDFAARFFSRLDGPRLFAYFPCPSFKTEPKNRIDKNSFRTNTERLRQRIEEEFFWKISINQKAEFKGIRHHKTQYLGKSCLGYLAIALKTSLQADREREQYRKLILDEKVKSDLIARGNAKQTRLLIMKRLEDCQEPFLKKTLREKLGKEMAAWKGNLWQLTRRYEEWLRGNLTEKLKRVSRVEHRHFFRTLNEAHAGLSRSLGVFRNILGQNVEKVLGVRLAEADWKIAVIEPSQPDIKTSRTFDYHIDLIWFLIPMFIFRRFIERHYWRQVPGEVAVNLSRLAAQWEERINKAIEGMRKQALQYVQDELATIEALLSGDHGQTDDLRKTIDELRWIVESLEIHESHGDGKE